MHSSSPSLADRERRELADLLAKLGPDAPTLCAGWTTAHLAAHLAVRDRRPDALVGLGAEAMGLTGPVASWPHRLEDRLRDSTPYPEVVAQVRSGPPPWSPLGWPGGRALNVPEFAIHHEDVRRAQPGWTPRDLAQADQDALFAAATVFARRSRGGLVLCRSDVPSAEKRIGSGSRTMTGEPLELLLWAAGRRDVAGVEVS